MIFEQWNMNDLMNTIKLYHQNSASRFTPYLLDFQYNYCEWSQLAQSGSKIIDLFRTLEFSHNGEFDKGTACPFNVRFCFSNIERLTS